MEKDLIIANTNYGPIRGRKRIGVRKNVFYSFQRIPYAKPPVGELRFKDPVAPTKWSEPLDATREGAFCCAIDPRTGKYGTNSSEDCLFLNVFTKELTPAKLAPVMVYIHGGGFSEGSSAESVQGSDFLLEKDVILVTINYRLGVFGFLSIDDRKYGIPGNAGLKDQSLALKWVTENCTHFGGDESNITVFGQSAGSASIQFHLISNYSKGLFHKVILQSGSALNAWAWRPKSDVNERLAMKLGWNGEGGTGTMLDVIMSAKPEKLVYARAALSMEARNKLRFSRLFVPVVEPYDFGSCFIPAAVTEIYKTGWGNHLPMLIGGTSNEGAAIFSLFTNRSAVFDTDDVFENLIPRELNLSISSNEHKKFVIAIKKYYYGNEKPTIDDYENCTKLLGDYCFWHGINATVRARLSNSTGPTYLYRLSYDSENIKFFKIHMGNSKLKGAVHCEELQYLFKIEGKNDEMAEGSLDDTVRSTFINIWCEFATSGNPNCNAIKDINWEPITVSGEPFKCLNIDEKCTFIELPETERMHFWDSLYTF